MMVDCFSLFGFPNLWHLSTSLSTLSSSNARFLERTFRTFCLIWSSVSPSTGLIPSTAMYGRLWYCCRLPTYFWSSEFVFFTTIWEISSNSTFCSRCLILAFRKDFLLFVSFCRIMFIWLFWCWWCGCVTLLLSVVGVSLVIPWKVWWHFYIFVVVFALLKCFLMFCIDWI